MFIIIIIIIIIRKGWVEFKYIIFGLNGVQ